MGSSFQRGRLGSDLMLDSFIEMRLHGSMDLIKIAQENITCHVLALASFLIATFSGELPISPISLKAKSLSTST